MPAVQLTDLPERHTLVPRRAAVAGSPQAAGCPLLSPVTPHRTGSERTVGQSAGTPGYPANGVACCAGGLPPFI